MAEAGEVAVWTAVSVLATGEVGELAAWALPVQERHLDAALAGIPRLLEYQSPAAPRRG